MVLEVILMNYLLKRGLPVGDRISFIRCPNGMSKNVVVGDEDKTYTFRNHNIPSIRQLQLVSPSPNSRIKSYNQDIISCAAVKHHAYLYDVRTVVIHNQFCPVPDPIPFPNGDAEVNLFYDSVSDVQTIKNVQMSDYQLPTDTYSTHDVQSVLKNQLNRLICVFLLYLCLDNVKMVICALYRCDSIFENVDPTMVRYV